MSCNNRVKLVLHKNRHLFRIHLESYEVSLLIESGVPPTKVKRFADFALAENDAWSAIERNSDDEMLEIIHKLAAEAHQ